MLDKDAVAAAHARGIREFYKPGHQLFHTLALPQVKPVPNLDHFSSASNSAPITSNKSNFRYLDSPDREISWMLAPGKCSSLSTCNHCDQTKLNMWQSQLKTFSPREATEIIHLETDHIALDRKRDRDQDCQFSKVLSGTLTKSFADMHSFEVRFDGDDPHVSKRIIFPVNDRDEVRGRGGRGGGIKQTMWREVVRYCVSRSCSKWGSCHSNHAARGVDIALRMQYCRSEL